MEQYQMTTADGQTVVVSGGQVVMQTFPSQVAGGHTLQTQSGQVCDTWFCSFQNLSSDFHQILVLFVLFSLD
jgi:hypothetical protein